MNMSNAANERHTRVLSIESLEPLEMLANGTATIQFKSAVPSTVEPNQSVDVTVEYRLAGNSKSGPWKINEISLYDDDGPVGDDLLASTTGSIGRQGSFQAHTFKNVNISKGADDELGNVVELYAYISIDDNTFNGLNAVDSSPVKKVTIGAPDLIATVTGVASSYRIGGRIDATASVKNQGSANAGRSDLKYYLGTDTNRAQHFIEDAIISGNPLDSHNPNEIETDVINGGWTIPDSVAPGTYRIWVQADSSNRIAESNENNNWASSSPFMISSIDAVRWENFAGQPVTGSVSHGTDLYLAVEARGFSTTHTFTADIFEDDVIQNDPAPNGQNIKIEHVSGNRWRGKWTATWTEDAAGSTPEFFFRLDTGDKSANVKVLRPAITAIRWENAQGDELADGVQVTSEQDVYIAVTTEGMRGSSATVYLWEEDDTAIVDLARDDLEGSFVLQIPSNSDTTRLRVQVPWVRDFDGTTIDPELRLWDGDSILRSEKSRLLNVSLEVPYVENLEPGVTIINAGWQPLGELTSSTPAWTIDMAEAILDRADGPDADRVTGTILVHHPDTSTWVVPGRNGNTNSTTWTNSHDPDDQIVLVFDWTSESNDLQAGWSEGAADSLFASLANPLELCPAPDTCESIDLLHRPLHFIGHSRGTVVNTLTASRIAHYFPEIMIDQFTTLDPHPQGGFAKDPGYEQRILDIPDNIVWADNYFRRDGVYELPDPDFDGVPVPGAWNLELTEDVLQGAGSLFEHSDVPTWYLATIQPLGDLASFDVLYADWWKSGIAYDASVESGSGAGRVGYARSRIGGGTLLTDEMDRDAMRPAIDLPPASVFNGDFELGDEFSEQIPGWERHGGGGSGNLDGVLGGNRYLQLNNNDQTRRHNPLYVAPGINQITFDYWIKNSDAVNANDQLRVLIGSDVVGEPILLDAKTSGFRTHTMRLGIQHDGFVDELEFQIFDPAGDGIDSAVRIDNVGLSEAPRNPGDTNEDGDVNFADFLALAANFGKVDAVWADGDFNDDRVVNFEDFLVLSENFQIPSIRNRERGVM